MKTCSKCGTKKQLELFHKNVRAKDGRASACRECCCSSSRNSYHKHSHKYADKSEYKHNWYLANKDRIQQKAREKHKENPQAASIRTRRSRAKYPEKVLARNAVAIALHSGKLERQPCERCGVTEVEAHHPDYSKPLEVVWLCTKHHSELHR